MTAESPESGTLRQALMQLVDKWEEPFSEDSVLQDPNNRSSKGDGYVNGKREAAQELEDLLDDHRARPEDEDE